MVAPLGTPEFGTDWLSGTSASSGLRKREIGWRRHGGGSDHGERNGNDLRRDVGRAAGYHDGAAVCAHAEIGGVMVTCRLLGVAPVFGVTESHVKPAGLVVAVAENESAVLLVLVIEIVFIVAAEPATAVTLIAPWLTLRRALLLTLNVTGITSGAAVDPGTVSVTLPLQTCGVIPCGIHRYHHLILAAAMYYHWLASRLRNPRSWWY